MTRTADNLARALPSPRTRRVRFRAARALLLALAVGGVLLGAASRTLASDPGTELERVIGHFAEKAARDAEGVDNDPLIKNWVRQMGAKVSAPSPRQNLPYTFQILKTDVDNAYTLPGAYIFVTRGLLDEVESDDELASVLAHESGHVAKRHALQQIENNAVFLGLLATLPAGKYNTVRATATVYNLMRTLQKSREMEAQADSYAIPFTAAAGYDPNGLVHFFQDIGDNEPSRLEHYFDTHPTPRQRIAAARESPLVTKPTATEREAAAQGYAKRGLPGEAFLVTQGRDPLDLPPLPPLPPLSPAMARSRNDVIAQADAVRDALRDAYRARTTAKRLSEALILNNQPGDLRWLYIAGRAYSVQQDLDGLYARTIRTIRVAPPTWEALARYGTGVPVGDPRAVESGLGRTEVAGALERIRGTATPLKRAARVIAYVFGDLNNRWLRPKGALGWARYGLDEALLRYAESELARVDKMSGPSWRLLAMARMRRYQLRLNELVPEDDAARRALWADLAQRRFGEAFPTEGPTGDATVRATLAIEKGASASEIAVGRGDETWTNWALQKKGIPENIATAMRLLTLDLERETAAEDRKRAVEEHQGSTVGDRPAGTGNVPVERTPPLAGGNP